MVLSYKLYYVLEDNRIEPSRFTVIQQRTDDDFEFHKNWTEYKEGFGNESTSFWLGLDAISNLTAEHHVVVLEYEVMINANASEIAVVFGVHVSSEYYNYTMAYRRVCAESTLTNGSLMLNDRTPFSTYDVDNDAMADVNCADLYGPWWFTDCTNSSTDTSNPPNMFHNITQMRLIY